MGDADGLNPTSTVARAIGLAAWLTLLEGLSLATGRRVYRRLFDFWLKIFGIAFGLGVVSGIVMAFEFGTNWSRLSDISGPIQGPLLAYESFTAFALEASFFGVLTPRNVVSVFALLGSLPRKGCEYLIANPSHTSATT
jgi:hypothetical protein